MIGNREQILFRLQRDLELGANKNFNYFSTSEERGSVSSDSPVSSVSSVSSDSSASPYQTFPGTLSEPIVVKQHGDLTCGMRCLQNMYGAYIVTREEMDTSAKQLELKSFGETMFNPQYGDYSIEVLKGRIVVKREMGTTNRHSKNTIRVFYTRPSKQIRRLLVISSRSMDIMSP